MRKLAIAAALASTALATPALAADGSMYVGIEGGYMIAEEMNFEYETAGGDFDFVDDDFEVADATRHYRAQRHATDARVRGTVRAGLTNDGPGTV